MSKISIYDVVPVPKLADKLIGTSVGGEPEDLTYNFTLGELLNLFIPNIPGNTLQGVLDFGNTATQDINLTGTINTTDLNVSGNLTISDSDFTGETHILGGLYDSLNSIGTPGQVLISTGTQVEWFTIPTVIPNLQQVLTSGNTAVNNIILTGNLSANNAALLTSTISTSLTLLGTLRDGLNAVGANNQVLSSSVTGVRWVNLPVYSAASPLLYNSGTGVFSIQQANASQGGFLSAADWITFDGKQTAINLTTTGNSGPSTLVGSTINVPNYTLAGLNGVPQTRTLTINGVTYNLSADRSWTIAAGVSSVTATSPLFSTGGATPNISIQKADSILDGYLSSADWLTFDGKQDFLGGTGLVKSVGGVISYITDNSSNWNTAFNDSIVSAAVTGTTTKLLTLNQQDGGTITASWSDIDTGLTSVGVSMPTAFTVTNSPLTSNGTIAITGSGNSLQYIDGTGALQTFPSLTGYVPYTGATQNVNLGIYSLTASSLIKNGGTSSQFLKADGSVDSSAYIVLGSLSASAPLVYNNLTGAFSIIQSGTVTDGYLSSTDWNTFNSKQGAITLTTTGSSGASTLIGNTLNIPQYTDQFVGTVTSVGLSMPAAFTVSNSPVTSSGTLTVVGAGLASQYVRGDGSLGDFPGGGGGGGSSVSYYLNSSVSQGTIGGVAYRELSKVPILGAGTDISTSTNGYIASYITDAGDPNLLEIPAGNWNFETYFSASSGGGTPTFYVELYKYDGTTFTLIASNSGNPESISLGTNINPYFSALAVPQTTLALTDRLAVRYYVSTSGRTITLHTENGHLCQIITTFTTGLTALNGLTTQVQFFSTGTAGTDFNISSSVATHTFNLPTASATDRGALSSADWITFNSKQPAGNYVTTDTTQTITALKTILRGGDVLNFKIGVDTLYGLKIAYNQNELVPSGEATWSFVNTFNNGLGTGLETTPISFFRGVLVTGERLLSVSVNSNLLSYYGNNPSGRYPIYAYNTGVQQFQDSILVGFNTGVVNTVTGAIASLPAGVVANFNGRVIGSNAVNSNEFATLGQLTGGTVTSVGLTSVTSGVTIGSTPITTSGNITIAIATATGSQNGLLSSTDWTTFNSKQGAITLTTTGTSGASTLVGNTLNIPNYTDSFVGTVTSVSFSLGATGTDLSASVANSTTTPTITLNVPTASASARGALSSTDWSTFNSKQNTITLTTTGTSGAATLIGATLNIPQYQAAGTYVTSVTGTSPIVSSGGTTPAISIPVATTSVNGYLSSTDWTTFNSKQNALTNPVTGTGTTNYLPKFTGSTTIGNSQVFDNGTNVGIGTGSTGGSRLNILNIASNPVLSIRSQNNVYEILTMTFDESTDLFSIINKQAYSLSGIAFGTNNTERVRIAQSGNLLVGTTTDGVFKLDVNGTGRFSGSMTANGVMSLGNDGTYGSTYKTLGLTGDTNGSHRIFAGTADNIYIAAATARGIYLCTNGTVTPQLTIASTGAATFSSSVTAGGQITGPSGGTEGKFNFIGYNNAYGGIVANTGFNTNYNAVSIYSNFNSTRNGQGNTSNPSWILDLGGSIPDPDSFSIFRSPAGSFTFSNLFKITSGGNVGIGVTPSTILTINGGSGSYPTLGTATANALMVGRNDKAVGMFFGYAADGNGWIQQMRTDSATAYNLILQPVGGNVLIGTTTDNGAKLQLFNSGTATQLIITGGDTSNQRLEVTDGTVTNRFGIFGRTNGDAGVLGTQTNHALVFNTNNTERMRINSGGEVLVGTTTTDVNTQGCQLRPFGLGIFVRSGASTLQLNRLTSDGIIASFRTNDVERGSISIAGSVTSYNVTSDYRLKEDFQEVKGLEKVGAIKVYDYKWKLDEKRMDGVLAHELAEVLPYAVFGEKDEIDENGNNRMQSVDYSKIVPIMIKAIQELNEKINK
jgi:hypothetical protein